MQGCLAKVGWCDCVCLHSNDFADNERVKSNNLNTQSPSISNLSAHVDLFLLVRIYVSSPSLPGLSSNMLQGWADLFSAVHGVHIAFILCICKQSRPAANATFRRWSSCSCVTCVIFPYKNWKVRSTSFSNSPTPSYTACVWHTRMQPHKHTQQQLPRHIQPFLPGAGTAWDIDAWFTSWSGAEHVWQQGP